MRLDPFDIRLLTPADMSILAFKRINAWVFSRLEKVSVQLKIAFDAAAAKAVAAEEQVNDLKMELADLRSHDRSKRHCSGIIYGCFV